MFICSAKLEHGPRDLVHAKQGVQASWETALLPWNGFTSVLASGYTQSYSLSLPVSGKRARAWEPSFLEHSQSSLHGHMALF